MGNTTVAYNCDEYAISPPAPSFPFRALASDNRGNNQKDESMNREERKLLRQYSKVACKSGVLWAFQRLLLRVAPGMLDQAMNPSETTEAIEEILGTLAACDERTFRTLCRIAEKLGMERPKKWPIGTAALLQ